MESPEWLETGWLWAQFGKDRGVAKKRYRDFVESAESADIENPFDEVVGGVVLGGGDFVNWVKKSFLNKETNRKEIPQLKSLKPRPTPDELTQAVCDEFGCGREIILRKGKKRNIARDVAIYLCREVTGETGLALGRRFDISRAGITIRHNGNANQLEADRGLKRRIDRIRKKIINI